MDYSAILKQSWQTVWQHKVLWVFGLFIFSGDSIQVLRLAANVITGLAEEDSVADWFDNYWWVVIIIILAVLLWAVVASILHWLAVSSVIHGADRVRRKLAAPFGTLSRLGAKSFWHTAALYILFGITKGVVGVGMVLSLLLLAATIIGLIVVIPAVPVLLLAIIPVAAVVHIVFMYALQSSVLERSSFCQSFIRAWQLFRQQWAASAVTYCLTLLIQVVVGFVEVMLVVVVLIPVVVLAILLYRGYGIFPAIIVGSIGAIGMAIIIWFIQAIKQSFVYTLWHNVYAALAQR